MQTIIVRHRRENLKKCSLRGLENREDLCFLTYPRMTLPPCEGYILLSMEGPVLSEADDAKGLVLLDGTWRYAAKMMQTLQLPLVQRSLPAGIRTAYPRRQEDCSDPTRGLASVEALYVSYRILGLEAESILVHYHFKDLFLEKNRDNFLFNLDQEFKKNKENQ